mgnify:FL=1|jgi:hypothetical protein
MRTLCLPVSDRETPASTANAASQADAVCISSGAHRCASRAAIAGLMTPASTAATAAGSFATRECRISKAQ